MIETKFKNTEVGIIPEDWNIVSVEEVGDVITGSTPSTNIPEYYGTEFCFVSPYDLGYNKYIDSTNKNLTYLGLSVSRKIPKGSILYTCTGSTIGKIGIANKLLTTNQQINSIVVNSSFSNEFVYYAIQTRKEDIKKMAAVQAVPLITKGNFSKAKFACPNTPAEQERIATALSDIDGLIMSMRQLIEKKRNIKTGVMQELLSGKKRLKGFSGEWKEEYFSSLYSYASEGGTPSTSNKEFYERGNIPFVKIEDTVDKYIYSTNSYINEKGLNNSSAWIVPANSIILTNGATIGNVSINKIEVSTKQGILGIKVKPNYDVEFLYYLFSSYAFQKELHIRESGGTFATVILKSLNTIPVLLPPTKAEQEAIAKVLSDIDAEIEQLEKRLSKYEDIKQGMMQQLLTGKIRLI